MNAQARSDTPRSKRPRSRRSTGAPGSRGSKAGKGAGARRRGKRAGAGRPGAIAWLVIVGVSALTVVGMTLTGMWLWGQEPAQGEGFVAFEIAEDEALGEVADRLASHGLVDSATWFAWYKRLFAGAAILEPGEHWVPADAAPRALVQSLARRRGRPAVRVSIPEGWDSFQIAGRLSEQGICGSEAFLEAVFDPQASAELSAESFEGYLYPATYELRQNMEPSRVVERLVQEARTRFAELLKPGRQRGLTGHELVTLASVVEREAADASEVGTVASVFFNRLEDPGFRPRRMLQSDPTAAYGCKLPGAPASCTARPGAVTKEMLRDAGNPYNTYKHPGLPPGPVGNPSVQTLSTVLRAPRTGYYFFVLGPDGRHRFSRTLEEHRAAIPR